MPYGGGNPTLVAVLNGEADIGVLPIALVVQQGERMRTLGVFNDENILAARSNDAPPINRVFGTRIPPLPSSRSWAIHTEVIERHPDRFRRLEETAARVFEDEEFRQAYARQGLPVETIRYGDRQVCTDYALAMIELAGSFPRPAVGAARMRRHPTGAGQAPGWAGAADSGARPGLHRLLLLDGGGTRLGGEGERHRHRRDPGRSGRLPAAAPAGAAGAGRDIASASTLAETGRRICCALLCLALLSASCSSCRSLA